MNTNAKGLARKLTIHYSFLQGSYWMSFCIINGFAAVFLESKHFNNTQIGIVLSLAAIFSVLSQSAISSFADNTVKFSLKNITVFAMFIVFALSIILLFAPESFLLIATLYVFIYTLQLTTPPLINSLALDFMNSGIPLNYGLARGIGSMSFAVVSYILGIIVEKKGPLVLLPCYIIIYLVLIILTFTFKISSKYKFHNQTATQRKKALTTAPTSMISIFTKYKKFSLVLLGIVLLFTQHNMINTYLIKVLEHVGGNSTDLGLSLSIAAALELPTMAAFVYLTRKAKCSTLLKVSAFFFVVKSIAAWVAPSVLMVQASQALQMFAFALFTPASVYYVNNIMEEQDRVKGQALIGIASMGLGGTLGNLIAGRLLDISSVSTMLATGSFISLAGCLLVISASETVE